MILNVVKRMKFETNLVFLMNVVVGCGFMESRRHMAVNKFRKASNFSGERCAINFTIQIQ